MPLYEEMSACIHAHIPWTEWENIHWLERSNIVAHYRMSLLIDMHVSDAAEKAAKR